MKAKRRTLGMLLFLILLAGGVFALLTLRNAREEQAASAAADGTIPLAAVSGNDLTQIVLHYQGETNTPPHDAPRLPPRHPLHQDVPHNQGLPAPL